MNHKTSRLLSGLLCTVLLGSLCVGAAAPATVHAEYWHGEIVMDGNQTFLSSSNAVGKRTYMFSYQGTIYMTLRDAGELMGKEVSWNGATQTVTFSGTSAVKGELKPLTDADTAQLNSLKAHGMEIQICPDISVVLDGTRKAFTNAKGETVYPAAYDGSTYLPLRSVGELIGKEVSFVTDENGASTIYLSAPLPATDEQELETFLKTALPITNQLEALCKNALELNYQKSDPEGSEKVLRQIRALLGQLDALPKLKTDFADNWYSHFYLEGLAKSIEDFDAGLSQLDKGVNLTTALDANDAAFSLAVQRLWQTIPSFVSKIDKAFHQTQPA